MVLVGETNNNVIFKKVIKKSSNLAGNGALAFVKHPPIGLTFCQFSETRTVSPFYLADPAGANPVHLIAQGQGRRFVWENAVSTQALPWRPGTLFLL